LKVIFLDAFPFKIGAPIAMDARGKPFTPERIDTALDLANPSCAGRLNGFFYEKKAVSVPRTTRNPEQVQTYPIGLSTTQYLKNADLTRLRKPRFQIQR